MFRAHIIGIVVGNAIGVFVAAAIKKFAVPRTGLGESPMDALASLIKKLPDPPSAEGPFPPRESRTAPQRSADS
jgi:hypothetical protein